MDIRRHLVRLVAVCIVPAAVLAVLLIGHSYQRERATIEGTTMETARALTQAVDRELVRGQAALQVLARSSLLAAGDMAAFYREAHDVLALLPGDIIVLSDASGQQLINTQLPFGDPLPRRVREDELRHVFDTGQPAISDLFIGALERPVLSLDVPVHGADRVIFDLALGFYPDRLGSILKQQSLPPGWVAAIFDRNGAIAARTHDADRYIGHRGSPPLVRRMSETAEGSLEAVTLEGIEVVAVFSRSSVSNWSVAIGIPRTTITGYLWTRIAWVIGGSLVLLLSGIALAHVFGSKIAGSIRALIQPATALGRGEPVVIPPLTLAEADEVGHALQRASRMLRDREEILGTVSHDMRNPVSAILLDTATAELTAAQLPEAEGERLRSFAAPIADAARRMSAMLDDLLAVAVLNRGNRYMLKIAPIEASSLLSKACDAVRPLFERAGVALEMETVGALPALNADPDRALRVFVNLLDNALKFTERSGRVILRAEPHPDGIQFCIANSGQALSAEELKSMFQPFWQAAQDDRRGAGLGLSICRSIVEAHGGQIWAEPQPGMRVRICFVLPTANQKEPLQRRSPGVVPQPTGDSLPSSHSIL